MSVRLVRGDTTQVEYFRWKESGSNGLRPQSVARSGESQSAERAGEDEAGAVPGKSIASFEQQLLAAQHELAEARALTEITARESFQAGREEGRRETEQAAQTELESLRSHMATSLIELARARQELLEQADTDLIRLSVAIAEKVLHRQLHLDTDALRGVARAALERLAGKPVQTVRIHPVDGDAIADELATLAGKGMRLLPDATLARGTLLFETEFGVLDCSIVTQLEEIEHGLVDRLQRSQL